MNAPLFFLLFLACFFFSCKETDQPLPISEQLDGVWLRKWHYVTNTYHFHEGLCQSYAVIPGQPSHFYAYAYTIHGDTIQMIDLETLNLKCATISFPTDSTAYFDWNDGINYELNRQ